jgi:hypothetical protein
VRSTSDLSVLPLLVGSATPVTIGAQQFSNVGDLLNGVSCDQHRIDRAIRLISQADTLPSGAPLSRFTIAMP